MFKM
jgi:hypothetical protein